MKIELGKLKPKQKMTPRKIPDIIKLTARKLRQNETEVEKILWEKLKNRKLLGKKFLRQYPIYVFTENSGLDRFVIPDFVCKESNIIIELDGGIHELEETYILDRQKELLLKKNGYCVIRFDNNQILNNIDKILIKIEHKLTSIPPFS